MKIWDISQVLDEGTPVWPGDQKIDPQPTWVLGEGGPVNVSSVRLSTHTGTHADAPLHYGAEGKTIGEVGLEAYLGSALVVDGREGSGPVTWADPR